MNRIFLLSPARSGGRRAHLLTRPEASFELARRVQIGDATLAEIFAFCSGLYFRGKLSYARRFGCAPPGIDAVQVISPSRGLVPAETRVGLAELREFSRVQVDSADAEFTQPLRATCIALAHAVPAECEVVLLGSIATGKYVDTVLPVFGTRLLFPSQFIGRGDMSRGGLLLRCVAEGEELEYIPVAGALRKGARPPKLAALPAKQAPIPGIRSRT